MEGLILGIFRYLCTKLRQPQLLTTQRFVPNYVAMIDTTKKQCNFLSHNLQ